MMRIFLSSNKVAFSCTLIISIILICLLGTKASAVTIEAPNAKIISTLSYPDSEPNTQVAGITQFALNTPIAPPCLALYVAANDKLMQALIFKAAFLGKLINVEYDNQVYLPIDVHVCKVYRMSISY